MAQISSAQEVGSGGASAAAGPRLRALLGRHGREIVLPLVQQGLERVFQQPFRQSRIVRQIGECDLGLDHPELGKVAAGIRVLGAERRPEGVDLGQG